tara:strand:+ start:3575 stop:4750 length:1176 start_codon:yes stop_codon:yes gene_type:complete
MKASHLNCEIPFNYKGVNLSGFKNRSSTQPLGENKLFIDLTLVDSKSTTYFISIDTLYISEELYLMVKKGISEFDQNLSDIVINASHTHSAPNIFSENFGQINLDYKKVVFDLILSLAKKALSNLETVKIRFKAYEIKNKPFVFRRKKIPFLNIVKMLPNHKIYINDDIKKIEFSTKSKSWSWISVNCHPVFNSSNQISSDYIGEIRKEFKNHQFFQGFSGDIRPNITSKVNRPDGLIKKIFSFVIPVFTIPDQKNFNLFSKKLTKSLNTNPIVDIEIENNDIKSENFKFDIYESKNSPTINIKVLFFSNFCSFISINAEVSNLYLTKLNHKNIFPSGCSNGMIGYLPTSKQLKHKGYENYYSLKNYNLLKPFSKNKLKELELFLSNIIKY